MGFLTKEESESEDDSSRKKKMAPKKEVLTMKQRQKIKSRAYISDSNSSLSSDNEMLHT